MRNKTIQTIKKHAKNNKNIILLAADLGFNVLEPFQEEFPNRFFNCGIAEQNLMGVAAGLAKEDKQVFLYSINNFLTARCLEQVRNDCALNHLNVNILCVGGGLTYGTAAMSHHGTEDIAIMRALPNVIVATPCDKLEAECIIDSIIDINETCYIRLERANGVDIHNEINNFEFGKAIKIKDGNDIVIFAVGSIINEAIKASEELSKQGLSIAIYSFPTVKPLDEELIKECAQKFKLIVTLEEHNICGGFGSAVSEVLSQYKHDSVQLIIGIDDTYSYEIGSQEYLRKYYKIDSNSIQEKIIKKIEE